MKEIGESASTLEEQITRICALNEPVRRRLYLYVVRQGREVSRGEAAREVGVSRELAAFHLDKLVGEGLLEASYGHRTGRGGRGAGRTSKLYRRAAREFELSIPPRRYELVAQLLAQALDESQSEEVLTALRRLARRMGENLGGRAYEASEGDGEGQGVLEALLAAYGFEPYRGDLGEVRLRNCPFRALVEQHHDLVCGVNFELMQGLVAGVDRQDTEAFFEEVPGECCVVFHARQARS
jgi:predicted ArsR family transcriptional regulator